ncbi:MAG: IS1634 family transposase [Dehalococcoidales bacterium]|nr:IS1634 family transposase [Dehalococcoidales bacterium]
MSLVYVKNKRNGVTYVYESVGYWDKEKKQARNRRKCIGKLDPQTGQIIPSNKIDLADLPSQARKRGPKTTPDSQRRFYGATYLFDAIGEKLGVTRDFETCFPDNYRQIMSLSYYLVLEDRNPMSRFPRWALTHIHPYGKELPSQRSSEILGSITEAAKLRFFIAQGKRRVEKEFLAYDITSISSYSTSLKQVKYGLNKENDSLPQINLALLFGENSRLPVYFRKLPGNITDVKTVKNLLADIDFLNLEKVQLVMDRGFYSEDNINALFRQHYNFLISTRTSLLFVRRKLDEVCGSMASRPHYSSKYGLYYDSFMLDWDYTETKKRSGEVVSDNRRIYLHLFYNDQRATDDKIAFNKFLDALEYELTSDKRNPEHEKQYDKYYEISETPVRGVKLLLKQEAISAVEKYYGYFALLSNGVKDPLEALEIYRSKDLIEKAFGNLKERLNMRRTSVSSDEHLEGKLFVQFVALIYLSYIKKAMSDHNLFKDYTLQELLDELDVIERFEQPGHKPRIGEITQKQANLYACLGVNPPA